MTKFNTLAKVVVVNTLWTLALLYTYFAGFVNIISSVDITYISVTILLLVLAAAFISGFKAVEADKFFEEAKMFGRINGKTFKDTSAVTAFITRKLSFTNYIAAICVSLGLLGTILGFAIGFYGIDAQTLTSFDSVVAAIGVALPGISIAFYTTITGILGAMWVEMNHYIINQKYLETYYTLVNKMIKG